mmetsp:Transcript_31498/g.92389  ORF Transcript_31498/g.92389 Transcript_31498/m.92389 type:complete len:204 (+) Transcript_31498:135-746(+)
MMTTTMKTAVVVTMRLTTGLVVKTAMAMLRMPSPPSIPVGPIPPRRGTCPRRRLSTAATGQPNSAPSPRSVSIPTTPPRWPLAASWSASWRPWAIFTRSSAFRTAKPSPSPAGCEAPASTPSPSGPLPSARSCSMVSMPSCFRPKRMKRTPLPKKMAMAMLLLSQLLEPRPGSTGSRPPWPPTARSSPSPSPPSCAIAIATST